MAIRKPYFSGNASIAGGSPPPALAGSGRTPDPHITKKKRSDEMRTRDVTITVRCTRDERDKIRERASSRGLKLSDFVLRSALGKKIVVADGFWEMGKQLKAVGNNLNQLTRLAHEGRIKSVDLNECSRTLFDIYGRLGEILREVK